MMDGGPATNSRSHVIHLKTWIIGGLSNILIGKVTVRLLMLKASIVIPWWQTYLVLNVIWQLLMSKHHNMWATHGECSCIKVMWFWIWWLCRFCVVIWVFHPCHNGQWPLTWKDLHPRFYPLYLFSYLKSWESASMPLFNVECQTRELLVPFWYVAVLDCGLNAGPPTLKVRTLPLGYWGGLNSCDKKSITSLWLSERWYNDCRFLYLYPRNEVWGGI